MAALILGSSPSSAQAETRGEVVSIDPTGDIYVSLGAQDGVREGDLIAIYDGGERLVTLPVIVAYRSMSKLEPPIRVDFQKLREGFGAVLDVSARLQNLEGTLVSYDPAVGRGFASLGVDTGLEPGMELDVLEAGRPIAHLTVDQVFRDVARVSGVSGEAARSLEGLGVRVVSPGAAQPVAVPWSRRAWRAMRNLDDEVTVRTRSYYTLYDIEGNSHQSFYPPGSHYRHELDLQFQNELKNGWAVDALSESRWTDDSYVDPERVSLERNYLDVSNRQLGLRMRGGDVIGRFTDYSLVTALKGVSTELERPNDLGPWGVKGVVGVTKSRWEDLWAEVNDETYTRYVTGARAFQALGRYGQLGGHVVSADDDETSTASPGTVPVDNKLIGTDLRLTPFEPLTIVSEFDGSVTRLDERDPDNHARPDTALNVETDLRLAGFLIENDFERVGTNFRGVAGTASVDRQEHLHRVRYAFQQLFEAVAGYRSFHDNLKKKLTRTTFTTVYEGMVRGRPLLIILPELLAQVDVNLRRRESSDTAVDETTDTYSTLVEHTTYGVSYGGNYTFVQVRDDVTVGDSRDKHIWDVFIRFTRRLAGIRVSPMASYGYQVDKQHLTKVRDFYHTVRVGAAAQAGSSLSGRLYWTLGETNLGLAGRDQTRNHIDAAVAWHPFRQVDRAVELTYRQNGYNREDDALTFTEHLLEVSYTQEF